MGLWAMLKGEEPSFFQQKSLPRDTGQHGEYLIAYALKHGRLKGKYRIFQNLYIPTANGTTEIDILLLHEKGLFVIESKNYQGSIFADPQNRNWMQVIKKQPYGFFNPIRQNQIHIHALAQYLNIPTEHCTSLVVFSNKSRVTILPHTYPQTFVIRRKQLLSLLRRQLRQMQKLYFSRQIDDFSFLLERTINVTSQQKQQHIHQVQNRVEPPCCPICYSPMVRRKGPYGEFWSCSSYPHCQYTSKLQ